MGCSSLAMQKAGKQKHKKGLWSPEEDLRLRNYIHKHGHACWSSVPINAGLQRTGKSCRLRWINYLRPGLKRGMFTAQEDHTIFTLHSMLGNKWSQIARHLPGRTDNEIKNYWHSYLKKMVSKMDENQPRSTLENPSQSTEKTEPSLSSPSQISVVQNQLHEEMQTLSSTKENSNVPKVLFTEWLSLDQFQGQKLTNTGKLEVSKDAIQHDIDTYYSFLDDFLLNEGVFNGSFYAMDDISNQFSMNNDVMYM